MSDTNTSQNIDPCIVSVHSWLSVSKNPSSIHNDCATELLISGRGAQFTPGSKVWRLWTAITYYCERWTFCLQ